MFRVRLFYVELCGGEPRLRPQLGPDQTSRDAQLPHTTLGVSNMKFIQEKYLLN